MISALLTVAGCGPVDVVGSAGSDTGGPVIIFEEDAEPAVAALPFVDDELLVQPYPGVSAQALTALYRQVGASVIDAEPDIDLTVLRIASDRFQTAAAALLDSGLIETVQKNYLFDPQRTPDDPLFRSQRYLETLNVPDAWDVTVGDEALLLAIVDTGVDASHPDLADRVVDGWNVHDDNADFTDPAGHGTSVVGAAAAVADNELGVAGVTWENPVIVVRVGDEQGRASSRHLAAGILWALGRGAKVINLSYAPLWSNRVVRSAAQTALARGSLVVISAGNGGGATRSRGFEEALFIGAIDGFGRIAAFSDQGPFVDLVAPGVGVYSTRAGGTYAPVTGTSFAAPLASGVAALAWSVRPELRPSLLRDALIETARDVGPTGRDDAYGLGLIDAAAAVRLVRDLVQTDDTTPPVVTIDQPRDGDVLTRRTTVVVQVSDNDVVADAVLLVDGAPSATDIRPPYRMTLDPTAFDAGEHELSVTATDVSGNASTPASISVVFAPTTVGPSDTRIDFRSPSPGAAVSGDVTIEAVVADPDGLAVVEWFVDGVPVFTASVSGESTGLSYRWRTSGVEPGPHTVSITITDALGARTTASLSLNLR